MKIASSEKTWLILGMLLVLSACSGAGDGQPDATLTALSASVAGTATAAQLEESAVNKLATAQAEATATSQAIQARQTANAVGRSEEELAEATRAAPIIAELPQYGLDESSGRVGWLHDPLTLEVSTYMSYAYGNDHMEVTAADFVLAADITWDTRGSSGCGFMFRSNGDEKHPNQYMVLASRFATGHVVFTAISDGEIANVHDFYPKSEDPTFDWQNLATNRLAIVARGNLIEIYTNGVKIGEVDTTQPPSRLPSPSKPIEPLDKSDSAAMNAYYAQLQEYEDITAEFEQTYQTALRNYMNREAVFTDGFLAMVVGSESGRTVCTFEDAWLWLLEP
jgi:hypothetical protein